MRSNEVPRLDLGSVCKVRSSVLSPGILRCPESLSYLLVSSFRSLRASPSFMAAKHFLVHPRRVVRGGILDCDATEEVFLE